MLKQQGLFLSSLKNFVKTTQYRQIESQMSADSTYTHADAQVQAKNPSLFGIEGFKGFGGRRGRCYSGRGGFRLLLLRSENYLAFRQAVDFNKEVAVLHRTLHVLKKTQNELLSSRGVAGEAFNSGTMLLRNKTSN